MLVITYTLFFLTIIEFVGAFRYGTRPEFKRGKGRNKDCTRNDYRSDGDRNYGTQDKESHLSVRKEWRRLSRREQRRYIRAVKCLYRKPSEFGEDSEWPGAVTLYDDLTLTHILQTRDIHFNGQFLPWHRYHLYLFEQYLRCECRYQGPMPYWDSSLDVPPNGNFLDSPIFDPKLGFGGNGESVPIPDGFQFEGLDGEVIPVNVTEIRNRPPPSNDSIAADVPLAQLLIAQLPLILAARTGGGCVTNGPFANLEIRLGPGPRTASNKRCLNRDFGPALITEAPLLDSLESLLDVPTYINATNVISVPHGAGHGSIGGMLGEMQNLFSSPNDPLFYLHHANIDRLWWKWQAVDLPARLSEVAGQAFFSGPEQVTLDLPLIAFPIADSRPVRDFMDIRELGYTYDDVLV